MTRFLFLFVVALALVALITRSPRAKATLWVVFGLVATYAVLKATGVIDAAAPSRTGVF